MQIAGRNQSSLRASRDAPVIQPRHDGIWAVRHRALNVKRPQPPRGTVYEKPRVPSRHETFQVRPSIGPPRVVTWGSPHEKGTSQGRTPPPQSLMIGQPDAPTGGAPRAGGSAWMPFEHDLSVSIATLAVDDSMNSLMPKEHIHSAPDRPGRPRTSDQPMVAKADPPVLRLR